MAKKNSGFSAWACGVLVAACAMVALMDSASRAQAGWGDDQSSVAAKKFPPSPPPPPLQLVSSWVGTIQDSKQGTGTIGLTFTEKKGSKTKSALKGTWTISFLNGTEGAINDVGSIAGSVTATSVALTLSPQRGDALVGCKIIFNSLEATAENISGTYRFAGCAGGNTGTIAVAPGTQATTVFVNIADDFFFPTKVTIRSGQTVRWTNNGGEDHSVNANPGTQKCKPTSGESFDSPAINPGTIFERTFNNAGTFAYHCEIHGCPMKGTIVVVQ